MKIVDIAWNLFFFFNLTYSKFKRLLLKFVFVSNIVTILNTPPAKQIIITVFVLVKGLNKKEFKSFSDNVCLFHVQVEEQLEVLTIYLRTKHKYCIWCGTKYEGNQNIQNQ